jgi:tRNA(Glu) U13 pseudouridine synthase TruD
VVYFVDDSHMREFLLAPLQLHVHDLINHQFVTLVITDDKKTAVETFRSEPDNPGLSEPGARQKKTSWDKMLLRGVPHTSRYRRAATALPPRGPI